MRPQRSPTDWSFTHYNLHGNQQVSLATVSSHSLLRHYRSESTGWVTVRESRQVSVFDLLQGHHSTQQLTLSPCPLLFRFVQLIVLSIVLFHVLFCPLFLTTAASLHKAATSPAFTPSVCCLHFLLPIIFFYLWIMMPHQIRLSSLI